MDWGLQKKGVALTGKQFLKVAKNDPDILLPAEETGQGAAKKNYTFPGDYIALDSLPVVCLAYSFTMWIGMCR